MDEQRIQTYRGLIQQLLDCPDEANAILNQSMELVDEGFVQACEQRAAQLQDAGQENQAAFLRNVAEQAFLAQQGTGENQQAALQQFWGQLLQAEMESGGDEAAVHQVMRQNMGLIVPNLGDVIAQFVQGFLAQYPDQAEGIAGLVQGTCISIEQFPYGRYAEALEIAIRGYGVVLELRADNPPEQAGTLNNLGVARSTQAEMGINPAAHLESAIAAYDEAAGIRRRLGLDKDLSATLTGLGSARLTQAEMGIDPAAHLESALAAYDEAAGIRRRLGLARDLARTLNNFGLTYQAQSRLAENSPPQKQEALENAYRRFQDALEQVEYLRGEIGADSEGYKRNFNEQWNRVYRGMVEVCLELGRYTDAIEYADRSKARNLVELIATRDAYPGGVIPENIRQQLQSLKIAINQEDRRLQDEENPDPTHLNQLRQQKQDLEPYKPLHFNKMQELLDEETAILEWYILPDKFLTFTLMPDPPLTHSEGGEQEADPSEPPLTPPSEEGEHSEPPFLRGAGGITIWTSSQEDLNQLIDWTNQYRNAYYSNKTQWHDNLSQRLETLAEILHLPKILQNLFKEFPNCKKLILIPHLCLHLFPLHALPVATEDDKGQLLQDLFPKGIAYAPNCQVLQQAQNRINRRPDFNHLFAIQNPTQDLHFTDMEVEAIQSLFNPHEVLKHDQAEKAAIDKETLKNTHCAHFSCHGYFNFEDALKSALILAKSELMPPPPTDEPTRYLPLKDNKLLDLQKCLTLEDILRLDLSHCRLVTLSACETGVTDFTSTSDEYIGLPSGFILAGSPNVVSTLWSVADLSTAILMIHLYQTLRNQPELSVVLVFQHSQKWLRSATVQDLLNWIDSCPVISPERREEMEDIIDSYALDFKPFESPYYWAAFCAIGQ